jgi:hypothetical protein
MRSFWDIPTIPRDHLRWHDACDSRFVMKTNLRLSERLQPLKTERGAIGWLFLWLIGIPVPLLIIFFLIRGCT